MSNLLSREQIFQADDRRYEIVEVPEWGGNVRLRSLSGTERDDFEAQVLVAPGTKKQRVNHVNIRARLIAMCAIDEAGSPLFEPRDVMTLASKSAAALERLFEAAQRLSGLTEDDVKDIEADFNGAQSESSLSG